MNLSPKYTDLSRWKDILNFTKGSSDFATPTFKPGIENNQAIHSCHVLVIGAGGLGCEILKNLTLSGFQNIEIIDMDTIELSNLNRQFLFREADIGKSKAEVAANFVMQRVRGTKVIPHKCKIEDMSLDFYRNFHIVICGLDSISARRWINATMCSLVLFDEEGNPDQSTIIPLIDGGTEGFKGNARVILPFLTPCIECTIDLYPPQVNYPMCTIAHTPRLPEHCIEYVKVMLWKDENPFKEDLNPDNPLHVEWVCSKAIKRAETYEIRGVDLRLTLGVLKKIIPAVATTNAVIAVLGSCVLEALKLASNISWTMNNYLNFSNIEGIYFGVIELEKNPNCIICSKSALTIDLLSTETLETFLQRIKKQFSLNEPSLNSSEGIIYTVSSLIPEGSKISQENLKKTLLELNVRENGEIVIADETLREPITIRLKFKNS